MIDRLLKTEISRKRYARFKKRKTAVFASWFFLLMCIVSFSAPLISNSKPIMITYKGETYFPAFFQYHPKEFGDNENLIMDYRNLELGENDSVLWPINPWNPLESNDDVDEYPSEPTSVNILGTDEGGRDVFARLLYGFQPSIIFAALVWFFSYLFGVIAGGVMGFYGGKVDIIGQRMVEVLSTVPQLFLIIILVSMFDSSVPLLAAIVIAFGWIGISYYVRAEFLKNRNREFVEAARSMGASNTRIFLKHILPNSLTPIITFAPFFIAAQFATLASLDYLGFGLPVPTPSWGEMLAQGQKYYSIAWWLAVYPSLCLFVTLYMLNLIGEGVRDAMDPNLV
ncbi:MAG: peptide ABC transporter permease [Halobacteriovorax sp.]|nr:peptide ABC transporter permease [Halobacteriovorax sp.]|tara:strand:- start:20271 stop:21290 length:1020 start_codon:yes stop_codon:yes gene_type:complete